MNCRWKITVTNEIIRNNHSKKLFGINFVRINLMWNRSDYEKNNCMSTTFTGVNIGVILIKYQGSSFWSWCLWYCYGAFKCTGVEAWLKDSFDSNFQISCYFILSLLLIYDSFRLNFSSLSEFHRRKKLSLATFYSHRLFVRI